MFYKSLVVLVKMAMYQANPTSMYCNKKGDLIMHESPFKYLFVAGYAAIN
tara:strand:- start:144 stop:293 length:150 start_codon:yes stop_codon:yes gene_type:complete